MESGSNHICRTGYQTTTGDMVTVEHLPNGQTIKQVSHAGGQQPHRDAPIVLPSFLHTWPVEHLRFNRRVTDALRHKGVVVLGDLAGRKWSFVYSLKDVGGNSADEVMAKLQAAAKGLLEAPAPDAVPQAVILPDSPGPLLAWLLKATRPPQFYARAAYNLAWRGLTKGLRHLRQQQHVSGACQQKAAGPAVTVQRGLDRDEQFRCALNLIESHGAGKPVDEAGWVQLGRGQGGRVVQCQVVAARFFAHQQACQGAFAGLTKALMQHQGSVCQGSSESVSKRAEAPTQKSSIAPSQYYSRDSRPQSHSPRSPPHCGWPARRRKHVQCRRFGSQTG